MVMKLESVDFGSISQKIHVRPVPERLAPEHLVLRERELRLAPMNEVRRDGEIDSLGPFAHLIFVLMK